jgi:hypothetical protein
LPHATNAVTTRSASVGTALELGVVGGDPAFGHRDCAIENAADIEVSTF